MIRQRVVARLTPLQRVRALAAAALVSGGLVAGCGGAANSPSSVASVSSTTTATSTAASTAVTTSTSRSSAATSSRSHTTTGGGAIRSGSKAPGAFGSGELAFSKCMRANGVRNYPDPSPTGGIGLPAGINPGSPVFQAAQTTCQKLVPGFGGLPGSGSGPPPSPQALAHWVKVAQCMRRHAINEFPDPRASAPSRSSLAGGGGGVISDRDGVILVFPATIDMQSPLFTRAAAACGFQLTNH